MDPRLVIPDDLGPPRRNVTRESDLVWIDETGRTRLRELTMEEEEELDLLEELTRQACEARLGSKRTIQVQDQILHEFREAMISRYHRAGRDLPIKSPDDDSCDESILFAQDETVLTNDIIFAIQRWMRKVVPRHHKDTRPKIEDASKRGEVLISWALERRSIDKPIDVDKIRQEVTTGIHVGSQNLWEGKVENPRVLPQLYFGRHELRQLLQWESTHSIDRIVSEQHELAWCLGCICGVQPCSLAETPHHVGQYLRWRDIEITRARNPDVPPGTSASASTGRFNATITFCFLKRNREDDVDRGEETRPLVLKVRHPHNSSNLIVSPALRLLAIMIRRGVILNINTIDELLNNHGQSPMRIMVKPEFLDKPVFLADCPDRRGVDEKRALSTNVLCDFFKRRCLEAGYPEHSSFDAWRQGAKAKISRATSRDTVRAMFGHSPDERTFERNYNDATHVDLFAIAHDDLFDDGSEGEGDALDTNQDIGERLGVHVDDDSHDDRPRGAEQSAAQAIGAPLSAAVDLEQFHQDGVPYGTLARAFLTWLLEIPAEPLI